MSHSRFRKTARQRAIGRLHLFLKSFLSGFLLLSAVLGTGSPGYGFESFEKFEKSKKQSLALRLEAMPGKDQVRPGETFRLYVVAILEKGWHLYSLEKQSEDETIATRIELESFSIRARWNSLNTSSEPVSGTSIRSNSAWIPENTRSVWRKT